MEEATFEDLAFGDWPLREVDGSRPVSIFERSELRSSREGRKEDGVKNLKGSDAISKNFFSITDLRMLTSRYSLLPLI